MDKYYDRYLATLVNVWAKPDLTLFGYRPWFPGRSLTGRGTAWTTRRTPSGPEQTVMRDVRRMS